MSIKRRPSLLGALLWIAAGVLFLLYNFGIVSDLWSLAARYWPVLLILLGLGKILEYFLKREAVSIRFGEIVGILVLLLIGTALTRAANNVGWFVRDVEFDLGGARVSPRQIIGDSHAYTEQATYPLEEALPIRVENAYGKVSVTAGSDREIRVTLKKVVWANEARAKDIASEIHPQWGIEDVDGSPAAAPMPEQIRRKAEDLQKQDKNQASPGSPATLKAEAEPGEKSGARYFVLRTNRDSLSSSDYQFNTDMEISVPRNSQVQVTNIDGEVLVAGINGPLDLRTKNKSVEVRDCTGQFNISAPYAECRLTNLRGNLSLDARGRVYIENIRGDVSVKNEYSSMEILEVDGKLSVSTTEGTLKVERVTKPVVINARGTQVEVAGLKDSLKITASHRDVDISDVASHVAIDSRYANLTLKDIQGDIEITSSSDNINADEIQGRFIVKARGTGVRANGVKGPIDIQTTLKEVTVSDFGDSCRIINEYAGISLSAVTLGKDVSVKNRNGDVTVFLPEDASFSIDAVARNGRVESDYAGLVPTRESNTGSLKSKVKAGGPKVNLETDYSNIHVYRADDGESRRTAGTKEVLFPRRPPRFARQNLTLPPRRLALGLNRIGVRNEKIIMDNVRSAILHRLHF